MDIHVTSEARESIKGFLERNGLAGQAIRLAVQRTRCMGGRGHAYRLDPVAGPTDGETMVEADGVRVVVDPESVPLLDHVRLELHGAGPAIAVVNSRAVAKCPCGHHDIFPE